MSSNLYKNQIAFVDFCRLLFAIRKVKAKPERVRSHGTSKEIQQLEAWIAQTRQYMEPNDGTITIFFRLLFPDEGVRRRYGIKEATMIKHLKEIFQLSAKECKAVENWAQTGDNQKSNSTGCLGSEFEKVLRARESQDKGKQRAVVMTMGYVDELLDELAARSRWSAAEVRDSNRSTPSRSVEQILRSLFRGIFPEEAAVMVQIILGDLSPILYPPPSNSAHQALQRFNTSAYHQIDVQEAMYAWHPKMPALYRMTADMDYVCREVENRDWDGNPSWGPAIGTHVLRPSSVRPGICRRVTNGLVGNVAAETKYDGERVQVHIDMSLSREKQIQIFSKSGRDSTETRRLLLPLIRATLNLDFNVFDGIQHPRLFERLQNASAQPPAPSKLIIEGEMVSYDEDERRIDEFWTLRTVKAGGIPRVYQEASQDSLSTGHTATPSPPRTQHRPKDLHLMMVWFDVVLLNDESLISRPYQKRRDILGNVVIPIEGYSMLAESTIINFDPYSSNDPRSRALMDLRLHFATVIAARGEGLMLKHLDSIYNDNRPGKKWIKLKKDFIPGLGDTMDVKVVGVSWQSERGRKLGVPPSAYTTFFIGFLDEDTKADLGPQRDPKPHYHVVFASSYGLDRQQLDYLGHSIRESNPLRFCIDDPGTSSCFRRVRGTDTHGPIWYSPGGEYTFTLANHLQSQYESPSWMLPKPRDFEVTGAGFQMLPESLEYELRWPRITKYHLDEPDIIDLKRLQEIAKRAMKAEVDDSPSRIMARIWGSWRPSDEDNLVPSLSSTQGQEVAKWLTFLERADGILHSSPVASASSSGRHGRSASHKSSSSVSRSSGPLRSTTNLLRVSAPSCSRPSAIASSSIPPTPYQFSAPFSEPSCRSKSTQASPDFNPLEVVVIDSDSDEESLPAPASSTPHPSIPSQSPPQASSDQQPSGSSEFTSSQSILVTFFPTSSSQTSSSASSTSSRKRCSRSSSPSPNDRPRQPRSPKRARALPPNLPPLSLGRHLSSPSVVPKLPYVYWSNFPPLSSAIFTLPSIKSRPRLTEANYLTNPYDVLWVSGLATNSFACGGAKAARNQKTRRSGVIFIEDPGDEHTLRKAVGKRASDDSTRVWLVLRTFAQEPDLQRQVFAFF